MKIINKSTGVILAEDVAIADTPFRRIKGLLGKKEFRKGQALILKPGNSIHTLFMKFPIDVLFLDRDNKVIKIKSCLRPFRLTPLYFKASLVIELPANTIQPASTKEGDTISFGY